jgi:hypothetical protein
MDNWSPIVNTLKYVESYQNGNFYNTTFQIFLIKDKPQVRTKIIFHI